jgi:glycosyltransferase involved in cell wall biosynthesis
MLLNHVLSSDTKSNIFAAIFEYFREFAPREWRVVVSTEPRRDADILHYHRPHLERRLRPNSVATVHHDLNDLHPGLPFDTFLERYRQAARVVCLNRGQAARLARSGIVSTITIPHGYNDRVLKLRDEDSFETELVRIGFVSKRYRRRFKGEAYLHDLAKRLSPASFAFVLVGEGRDETARILRRLGFAVRSFEYLPYSLFQSLYTSMDYLLMCSNFEGGPANLPEALATSTPILATPVGSVPDFVQDRVNGLLLSGDVDLDAQLLSRLADRTDTLSHTLRLGARAAAGKVPTWREVVHRHFSLYQRIADGEPDHD